MEILVFFSAFFFSLALGVCTERWLTRRAVMGRFHLKEGAAAATGTNGTGGDAFGLARSLGRLAIPKKEGEVKAAVQRLAHAGYRGKAALEVFYGIRLGLGSVLGFFAFFILVLFDLYSVRSLVFLFLPFAVGYYVPELLLRQKIKIRRQRIFQELPDTLDLLMVCLRAGLGFDHALYRVCLELGTIAPELSREFGLYFLEVKSGLPRTTALANLEKRNPSQSLKAVVTVLVQSASTGTDMVKALKVYTDSMRTRRRQSAEEQGAKLSTKLTLPLVIFILPALMMIILGPVIVNFIEFVNKGF